MTNGILVAGGSLQKGSSSYDWLRSQIKEPKSRSIGHIKRNIEMRGRRARLFFRKIMISRPRVAVEIPNADAYVPTIKEVRNAVKDKDDYG